MRACSALSSCSFLQERPILLIFYHHYHSEISQTAAGSGAPETKKVVGAAEQRAKDTRQLHSHPSCTITHQLRHSTLHQQGNSRLPDVREEPRQHAQHALRRTRKNQKRGTWLQEKTRGEVTDTGQRASQRASTATTGQQPLISMAAPPRPASRQAYRTSFVGKEKRAFHHPSSSMRLLVSLAKGGVRAVKPPSTHPRRSFSAPLPAGQPSGPRLD